MQTRPSLEKQQPIKQYPILNFQKPFQTQSTYPTFFKSAFDYKAYQEILDLVGMSRELLDKGYFIEAVNAHRTTYDKMYNNVLSTNPYYQTVRCALYGLIDLLGKKINTQYSKLQTAQPIIVAYNQEQKSHK